MTAATGGVDNSTDSQTEMRKKPNLFVTRYSRETKQAEFKEKADLLLQ